MATLYVENVPDDLYESLRQRARQHRKSIAAEVLELLQENIVTAAELESRQQFLRRAQRLRLRSQRSAGHFPVAEEIQREDRGR